MWEALLKSSKKIIIQLLVEASKNSRNMQYVPDTFRVKFAKNFYNKSTFQEYICYFQKT